MWRCMIHQAATRHAAVRLCWEQSESSRLGPMAPRLSTAAAVWISRASLLGGGGGQGEGRKPFKDVSCRNNNRARVPTVSAIICALTARVKHHHQQARARHPSPNCYSSPPEFTVSVSHTPAPPLHA